MALGAKCAETERIELSRQVVAQGEWAKTPLVSDRRRCCTVPPVERGGDIEDLGCSGRLGHHGYSLANVLSTGDVPDPKLEIVWTIGGIVALTLFSKIILNLWPMCVSRVI